MKLTVKALAIISVASIALPLTAVSSFAEDRPVSGPHYQLIAAATKHSPARYRYYENGDNPNYTGQPVYSNSKAAQGQSGNGGQRRAVANRRTYCPMEGCSKEGRFGRFLGGVIVGVLFGING